MNITISMNTPLKVTIKKGRKLIKPIDILYIKGNDKHSLVYFIDLTTLETNHLLKWYEERLPVPGFCRCHDSFIVNLLYVECISGTSFLMQKLLKEDPYLPISDKKRKATHKSYEEFIKSNNFH